MIYSIENNVLKVAADTLGAELSSIYSKKTDTEYLWQGDPAFWSGRAYNLFPLIGRRLNGIYSFEGKEYQIRAHGIARYSEFVVETQTEDTLVFLLKDNEATRQEYPFAFEFRVIYQIVGSRLNVRYEAKNLSDKIMPCSFGGHPGINVPFHKDAGCFEDYYLEFNKKIDPKIHLLAPNKPYMAQIAEPYPLEDGVRLPLRHELFDEDAIILSNTSQVVSLKSSKTPRMVTMEYPDYQYVGFWHINKPGAPYVCLEPWGSFPANDGEQEDLATKKDMIHVKPNETASAVYSLEFHEE